MKPFDVIILGAGAAGCYCAIHAAERGLAVALIEKNAGIGAKIRISGGGRCNLTNLHIHPDAYLSQNPHFCRGALSRHTQHDFLAWLAAQGLSSTEKTLGQLFCEQKSRGLLAALEHRLNTADVALITDACASSITPQPSGWQVETNQGRYSAAQLVLATGGPSFPKLGASDSAIRLTKPLGIKNIPFSPALVPLLLHPAMPELAGISTAAAVSAPDAPTFCENLLFTHRGLSGPAILQISSYRSHGAIAIDLLPDMPADFLHQAKRCGPRQRLAAILKQHLPAKLADHLAGDAHEPLQHYSRTQLDALAARLKDWRPPISGTEGMAKAEVSTGGIDTRELNPRTMMVKKHAGLYAIGEAVDVAGWLGGYNFQWAWSSAWVCAQALQKRDSEKSRS